MAGTLYIVATPIGNLGDISERALETLRRVQVVAAEDTRHSSKLLQYFNIDTPLISVHDHNEREQVAQLSQRLTAGDSIALISDAGTPLISDPGFHLVKALRAEGFSIVAIPGACAVIAALSIAALPTDRFTFEGFLPHKSGARLQQLQQLRFEQRTLVFYESPHRIAYSLQDMADAFGEERQAVICRELTKTYETVYAGSFAELLQVMTEDANSQRGEFVVLVHGCEQEVEETCLAREQVLDILAQELSPKQASKLAAKLTSFSKNEAYQRLLERKGEE